ncbi:hypothetical protein BH23PLA1_BH23PLA1_44270 [soil metagenome]
MQAREIRRPPGPLCLFQARSRPFAVDLEVVDGVVELDGLVAIPLCPPEVLGLSTYHREVVPVVRIEAPGFENDEVIEGKLVALILKGRQGSWGLRIDRDNVAVVDAPAEVLVETPLEPAWPTISGRWERGGTSFEILDPERSWRGLRDRIEHWYRIAGGRGPLPNAGER